MPVCNCNSLKEPLRNLEDIYARCKASNEEVYRTLDEIKTSVENWLTIYRCRVCGTLFAEVFPFSEMHGGGPKCLYQIETSDLDNWIQSYVPLTPKLRQAADDSAFFKVLGDEIGPEVCRHDNCTRLRIRNSVMCKEHHFEMLKGRPFLETT
jgi:hypothetical protein